MIGLAVFNSQIFGSHNKLSRFPVVPLRDGWRGLRWKMKKRRPPAPGKGREKAEAGGNGRVRRAGRLGGTGLVVRKVPKGQPEEDGWDAVGTAAIMREKRKNALGQRGIGALGDVLLNEEVEAAHIVPKGLGPRVPVGFGGGVFALPEGDGGGEFGSLSCLGRGLAIIRRGHVRPGVFDAFPFTEDDGIGDFAGGGDRKQRAFNFGHDVSRSFGG